MYKVQVLSLSNEYVTLKTEDLTEDAAKSLVRSLDEIGINSLIIPVEWVQAVVTVNTDSRTIAAKIPSGQTATSYTAREALAIAQAKADEEARAYITLY